MVVNLLVEADFSLGVDVRTPNPGLSQRMSYNKQLHADLEAQTHRTNIIHMQRRMRAYKPVRHDVGCV